MTSPKNGEDEAFVEEGASVLTNLCGKRYYHGLVESIVTATGCKAIEPAFTFDESDVAATQ